jgi:tRNA(Ile)-lysidine synthase
MTTASSAIKSAVRDRLTAYVAGDVILVAVSGGADSLALAHALSIEAKKKAIKVIGITIDHKLQEGSEKQASRVEIQLKEFGLKCIIKKVNVVLEDGVEASARRVRYEALEQAAQEYKAAAIFLGHTRDDQAETVLLGLARGSGTRSLSGMAPENGLYIRPLLNITRTQNEDYCKKMNLQYWNDPQNKSREFSRVRVREEALPALEKSIGPKIAESLARSAQLLRDDADALDQWAEREEKKLDLENLDCSYLEKLPRAIRSRIIRTAIYSSGAPSGTVTQEHVSKVELLISAWNGQGTLSMPNVSVQRSSGKLLFKSMLL